MGRLDSSLSLLAMTRSRFVTTGLDPVVHAEWPIARRFGVGSAS
jgi:hypothetical protein